MTPAEAFLAAHRAGESISSATWRAIQQERKNHPLVANLEHGEVPVIEEYWEQVRWEVLETYEILSAFSPSNQPFFDCWYVGR